MKGSVKIIDARGLACPQPVVLTKRALEEGAFDTLEVLVDEESARENVMRFAGFFGRSVEALPEEGGTTRVIIRKAGQDASTSPVAAERVEQAVDAGATVFLASDRIGQGDDELGALLMRGFVYALAEGVDAPERIILMNAGVKLAVHGSDSQANLTRLGERGVDILACGTCLDFFGLKEKLAVGRVSNMYEIAGFLVRGRVLRP